MNKQTGQKQNDFPPPVILPVFVAALFVLFFSCDPKVITERLGPRGVTETEAITALIPEPAAETETASVSQLVLESGNYWTAGVPGFGENALSAFTGEYRVPGMPKTVWVWLTREFLYYDGWTGRDSITSYSIRQKTEKDGLAAAASLSDAWTIVILLPPEISAEEEDRLITTLVGKFSGFSSQSRDISFPALIPY